MVIVESFRAAKIAWGSRKDKTLSFEQVCQNWGIYGEEKIPIGAKNFRMHALVWLVVISFAVYQSVANLDSLGRFLVPILFLFIGLWGLVQALWKLSVLRSRKYTPFFKWIAGN